MKAGEELDKLIHRHVFGLDPRDVISHKYCHGVTTNRRNLGNNVEPYSKDIKWAWSVVDAILAKPRWEFDIGYDVNLHQWFCKFNNVDGDGPFHSPNYSTSKEHAICLAALAAMGVSCE